MGRVPTKACGNVYFEARKQAAEYDARLRSREGAAELLGVAPCTLADYELGVTKTLPADNVVRMAELYRAPHLKTEYCATKCSIGCAYACHLPTSRQRVELVALEIASAIPAIQTAKDDLISIAKDGVIKPSELKEFEHTVGMFDRLMKSIISLWIIRAEATGGRLH